jgi:hypothetical protein
MSIAFITEKSIEFDTIFDGRLTRFDIHEHVTNESSEVERCLTDGVNFVWFSKSEDDGSLFWIRCYGWNHPAKILETIADIYDTGIFSEHQPQFHGFETQEEWDAAMRVLDKREEEQWYTKFCKFLRGEEHNYRPGTPSMLRMEAGRKLVAKFPELMLPENKDQVIAITCYDRDEVRTDMLGVLAMIRQEIRVEWEIIYINTLNECQNTRSSATKS